MKQHSHGGSHEGLSQHQQPCELPRCQYQRPGLLINKPNINKLTKTCSSLTVTKVNSSIKEEENQNSPSATAAPRPPPVTDLFPPCKGAGGGACAATVNNSKNHQISAETIISNIKRSLVNGNYSDWPSDINNIKPQKNPAHIIRNPTSLECIRLSCTRITKATLTHKFKLHSQKSYANKFNFLS